MESQALGRAAPYNGSAGFFVEALEWAHEREFLFGTYQNTVAHAMGGSTLHTGGDILVGAPGEEKKLNHTDVDVLFTRNQCLRWIVIDEIGMVADELLGGFEHNISDAAIASRYKKRADNSLRPFGGYNLIVLGDLTRSEDMQAL